MSTRLHAQARRAVSIAVSLIILTAMIMPFSTPVYSDDPLPKGPPITLIESDDLLVGRQGNWTVQSAAGASGGSYLFSSGSPLDVLTLEFYGSLIEVLFVGSPQTDMLAVEVDGTVLRTVVTTAETSQYQKATINYLSQELHTLRVYSQAGGVVGIDAFLAVPPVTYDEPVPVDLAASRTVPDHVVINELDCIGTADWIELYNPTALPVDLTGWTLRVYTGSTRDANYTFPTFVLYPGAYVVISEDAGVNTATTLYMNDTIGISPVASGAVALLDAAGLGEDFFRWNGSTIAPPAPHPWGINITFNGFPSLNSLSRNYYSNDTDGGLDWFTAQYSTIGRVNGPWRLINEVFVGSPDYVEMHNPSSINLNLDAYSLYIWPYNGGSPTIYDFPAVTLPAGGYLLIYDSELPGSDTSNVLHAPFDFNWSVEGAAVAFYQGSTARDFVEYGLADPAVADPSGAFFSGPVIPTSPVAQASIAHTQADPDSDRSAEWCPQLGTPLAPNQPCMVINEISTGGTDWVEIYNPSLAAYTMTNYQLETYENGASTMLYTFPTFTLSPGAFVRVVEGTGTNDATTLYTGSTIGWDDVTSGAVDLRDSLPFLIDYVRFGSETATIGGLILSGPTPPAPEGTTGGTLGRNRSSMDRQLGDDWCRQTATPAARNNGCAHRPVIFNTSLSALAFVDSTDSVPAPNDYYLLGMNAPAAAQTGGVWVMGDWDGDGLETPGVYATNGAFYYTNLPGPADTWTGIWFGLFGKPAVAGRFDSGVNHDCIGVIDNAEFPPYGTAFALYFTCDMTGGNPPKTFQWLSVLLPDSQGHTGAFQFAPGDYDGNGVDSIAVRRSAFIAWTNVPPSTLLSEFSFAQYIGAPSSGDYGTLLAGDWDNNRVDSFGLYYQSGDLYRRNDLDWNSQQYSQQALGQPMGSPSTATSTR